MENALRSISAAAKNELELKYLNFCKDFVEEEGVPLFVTDDIFRWSDEFFASTALILKHMPEHLQFEYRNCSPEEISDFLPAHNILYRNLDLRLQGMPFSQIQDGKKCDVPMDKIMSQNAMAARWGVPSFDHIPEAASTPLIGALGTDIEKRRLTGHPIAVPTMFGHNYAVDPERKAFLDCIFNRIKLYLIINQRNIKNKVLRLKMISVVINKDSLCPWARVVDSVFFSNAPCTNRSKFSRLIVWFRFLQERYELIDHQWSTLNSRAWQIASMFVLIKRGHFRNYFFVAFGERSTNDPETDHHYYSIVTEISKALKVYELTDFTLTAPKSVLGKIEKGKKIGRKTVSQKSTPVPLNLWLQFTASLFHSGVAEKKLFAILGLLNFLTIARFDEVVSLHFSQLQIQTRQISLTKSVKVLPIRLEHSKVGVQEYEIPVITKWELLNLEILLEQLRPFVRPNHLSLRELIVDSLSPLTNAKFNHLMDVFWPEFLSQPHIFFDPAGTKFRSHSLRKLSSTFYIDVLGFDKNYIRILYGHSETSRTLENVYRVKSRPQLVQEARWNF